jgi:hypothetical protein
VLKRFAAEVADDRTALLSIMATLGVPVRQYKNYAAWLAERVDIQGTPAVRHP